jgi:CRP/FNR family cyclic AMP-dependent transcriptional regulator
VNPQISAQGHARLLARLESYGLPKAAIGALVGRHTLVRYPKGAPLFSKGAPADVIFGVFSGLVKVYCPRPDGNRILVELAGPGDLIGYADFAEPRGERSQIFEAYALTNTSAALFTRHHILELLKGFDQNVLVQVLELVNSLWSTVAHRYATFLSMSLRERLDVVLHEMSERFGVADSRGTMLTLELAQQELAETIGSSRPMVSKLLTEMTERGTLARQGRRYILVRKDQNAEMKVPDQLQPEQQSKPEEYRKKVPSATQPVAQAAPAIPVTPVIARARLERSRNGRNGSRHAVA